MIDEYGYRANVGIIVANQNGQVLWAKCIGKSNWQFPQGGIDKDEKPIDAAYRELYEETGLLPENVKLLGQTRKWLRYVVPRQFRRKSSHPICIGQKQKWFLMRLVSSDDKVQLDLHKTPEFDDWRWVGYWQPLEEIVFFKRPVYRNALCELSSHVFNGNEKYMPEKYHTKQCK